MIGLVNYMNKEKVFYPSAEDYQELENDLVGSDWQLTVNPGCPYYEVCSYRRWFSKFAEYSDNNVTWLDDAGYFRTEYGQGCHPNYSTWGS
jgi:hypothetical protein